MSASHGMKVAAEEVAGGGLRRREDVAASAPLPPAPLFKNASEIPVTRWPSLSQATTVLFDSALISPLYTRYYAAKVKLSYYKPWRPIWERDIAPI